MADGCWARAFSRPEAWTGGGHRGILSQGWRESAPRGAGPSPPHPRMTFPATRIKASRAGGAFKGAARRGRCQETPSAPRGSRAAGGEERALATSEAPQGSHSRRGPRGHLLSIRTCWGWGLGSRCLPVGSRRRLHAVGAGSSALMRAPQSWGAKRGQGARRSPHAGPGPSERVRLRCSQGVRKGAEIPPEMLQSPRAAEGGARGLGRGSSPARGPGARIREEASGAGLRAHQLVATTLPPVPQPPPR